MLDVNSRPFFATQTLRQCKAEGSSQLGRQQDVGRNPECCNPRQATSQSKPGGKSRRRQFGFLRGQRKQDMHDSKLALYLYNEEALLKSWYFGLIHQYLSPRNPQEKNTVGTYFIPL